ncbi:DUF2026 family protein [Rhizobium sp. CSW-27]|uniref:DUF2026 family protein n=1 Tax=Rhizobium sp. CSW-27 TaxID=2839985 RepID=UPI001C026467|nr:DUF2026 family protein [Rhizobium sp. CSW-27]MBT9368288.1 DUF2026 domain-containing protein [Rhizobium sp. CSW-27]
MLIKQSDYHRIYKVIHSLLVAQKADPATASMYFASFGAFILKHHFKLQAVPKGGLAAYNLGGTIVLFADHRDDGYVTGAGETFHCWVEAEGFVLDFMAPAFPQAVKTAEVPARMFQKPVSAMAASINDLGQSGDFFLHAEPEAMARRFADWRGQGLIGDLASIASQWFRPSPKKMQAALSLRDSAGTERAIPLSGNPLSGSW